jgi:protein-ribulosamine 3-kinase
MDVLSPELLATLSDAIVGAEGGRCRVRRAAPVGGGCISRNFGLEGDGRRYFLKLGRGAAAMFDAEADGLAALARCAALVVPRVVCQGEAGGGAFLVLEWLDLAELGDEGRLGEAVAALHDISFPRFGWSRDNFIGSAPQANAWDDDWPRFFAERRLAPQLALAAAHGAPQLAEHAQPLLAALPRLVAGYSPTPGLLHGDLWAGNKGFVGGRPALFDPAVYAGDGETDLAMSELFGGFAPRFLAAYRAVRPLAPGYEIRRPLYQLYHVLNHFNLFGGGYARQADALIGKLIASQG